MKKRKHFSALSVPRASNNVVSSAWEGFHVLQSPQFGGIAGKMYHSFLCGIHRQAMSPMVTRPSSSWKRRLENGMRNSACQPVSSRLVFTSQNVFQSMLTGSSPTASLKTTASRRNPEGAVKNARAFSLSLKVSIMIPNQSVYDKKWGKCIAFLGSNTLNSIWTIHQLLPI